MAEERKKLLSVVNLKKYFPIAKSSIFQKEQLYVRANEDISFDIYQGETIGVVGESGCGKSTLGRVLLQLYEQTAGTTMYYGRTRSSLAPHYVIDTLNNVDKYISNYQKACEKVKKLTEEVEKAGDAATFYQHQDLNLAICEETTSLHHVASIIGGFMAIKHRGEGIQLLKEIYNTDIKVANLHIKEFDLAAEITAIEEDDEKKAKQASKLEKIKKEHEKIVSEMNSYKAKEEELNKKLADYKKQFEGNEDFAKYEAMLDDGIDLARLTYPEMRILRCDLQIIFQDPYSSLNPRMTIGQIIEEGLVTHGMFKAGSKAAKEYILETMEKCGLQDYMLHRYPHQFSGGQRQRVSIARALAVKPKFVVCDECVSALDVSIQSQIINLLQELRETNNLTYLFITHDLSVVKYISNKIIVMYLGNIVEYGTTKDIFEDPRHPYTIALLSSVPTVDVNNVDRERIILEGNIPSPIRPPEGCKFHTRCFMTCDKCNRVPPKLVEVTPGHFVACHNLDKKQENGKFLFEVKSSDTAARN